MNIISQFIYSKKPLVRVSRHVLFWTVDIINYLIVLSLNIDITIRSVVSVLLIIPWVALCTYFILYYLIPRYSGSREKKSLLLWILLIMFYLGVVVRYYRYYIIIPNFTPEIVVNFNIWSFSRIVNEILGSMVVVSMAIVIKLLKNKNELQEKNEQLMLEKQKAELNFLKAQMHPHFLFNTLNTLYSETIQESGKAQLVVLHLSQLLRFILDECSKPLIPLGHEIKVVKDYIGLEQLRHGERLVVKLVERDVDHRVLISPLIFLPFVENSFKHTLAHKRGRIHIDISISMKNDMVYFQVQNDVSIGHATIDHNREGKGLPNVVRQLDLLYNKQYVLNVEEKNEKFNVTLSFPVKAEFLYA